ncbi:MAG: DUF4442 domain-containing protein [Bacteroidetes bacterium]|nr:MAG: DUF4442 domain-containing protein [Bacteroidota bacterium]
MLHPRVPLVWRTRLLKYPSKSEDWFNAGFIHLICKHLNPKTLSFAAFEKLANSKLRFGSFLLLKLPSAWLCGVRLQHLDAQKAIATVPFKWLSQNPFNSIYFACQAMAAELSTGVLGIAYTYKSKPGISMLVTNINMVFVKKATSRVSFTCVQGADFEAAIKRAAETGMPQTVLAKAEGRTANGELISEFLVEWSFKQRTEK